jgi:cytoskeletal protein CcmA (bactofilin family)
MAIKALNSVAGFSVGEVPANIILANGDITASNAIFSGNLLISNSNANWGVLTDNLYYSNGSPWDLQQAAGSNSQVQFNDNQNFGASANFTFDTATNLLTLTGNIDVTNIVRANYLYANANVLANNVNANSNINVTGTLLANFISANANIVGNNLSVNANTITNNLTVNLELAGNTANFTGNVVALNTNAGNLLTANFANISSNVTTSNLTVNLEIAGNTANFTGNISALNTNAGNLLTANFANISSNVTTSNLTVSLDLAGNTANFTGNVVALNTNAGNLLTANYVNVASNITTSNLTVNVELSGNTANFTGNVILPNLTVNTALSGNTANFTGNLTSLNANLGNLATANYVNVANDLNGNVANFTGNLTSLNANLGNLATANYVNVANDLNVSGNIFGSNFVGALANGNSNVLVYSNSNVEVTIAGVANVATFTSTEFLVVGEIKTTSGNMLSNGNITANGFLNSANANVTGEALLGSVKTATIVAPTGNITISAAGTNENIILVPTGTGAVSVSGKKIIQLADPVNPTDAATKEYVDAMAGEGLDIHTPVRVESPTALTATYAQGGTTPTVDSITSGTIIDFGSAHGLSINDGIVFTNSFNGLVGGEAYWVYSIPSSTSITVKDGYFGPEITTLSNGTSLAEPSRANPGVGATLTNAGANAALTIDGITLSTSDRVLIYTQANAYENGIYTVTTAGDGSTAWVLTRATDFNKYNPDSPNGMSAGSYVFVTQGVTGAGESYVMTLPTGEVIIGTDNLTFTQFSAAGSYSAGSGINITGTSISANVDGVTTDIVGGNIVVKTSANLTTPNIGDATFSSLSWNTLSNGNVTANNLSISNIANITGNLRVDGIIESAGNITSNANVNSNNTSVTNLLTVGGNILANNIVSNNEFSTNTANISSNLVTSNLTVNLALNGNTANFSSSLAAGQTTISGNLLISNSTANWGVLTDNLYYSNGQPWDLQEAAGSNNEIQFNSNDNFAADANLTFNPATGVFGVVGTANISDAVIIGNTTTKWGTLTTTTVSANQTIASVPVTDITGVQFLVKGIDASGSKYSVATVQAVTNGVDSVDYATYGTVNLGGYTGALAVNVQGGFLRLQVTPASGNSTVWTTQYRVM